MGTVECLDGGSDIVDRDNVAAPNRKSLKIGGGGRAREIDPADVGSIVLLLPPRESREQQEEYEGPHRHTFVRRPATKL